MDIKYNLVESYFLYKQENEKEASKLNFLLTNNKGDFLMHGFERNSSKVQGLNVCNPKTLDIFKFVDEILLDGLQLDMVEYGGYFVKRYFSSNYLASEDMKEIQEEDQIRDRFYLGPTGGMVYEVENYEGSVFIDLDMRKNIDFDKWGRDYNVYSEKGIVFVEYTKRTGENEDYKLFLGIKAANFAYDLKKEWIRKEYEYSKARNSMFELYVYRLMSVDVSQNKRLVFGAGFSKDEVIEQISLLEVHQQELEGFDKVSFQRFNEFPEFEEPLNQDVSVAYSLSNNAVYNFLNKNLEGNVKQGSFAGFPWFADIWARDELVGLRVLINNSEDKTVKDVLRSYLDRINPETGMFKRIEEEGSLESADAVFLLAKRFEDFLYHLNEKKRIHNVFSKEELMEIFDRFYMSFEKIVENLWNSEFELLRPKKGDSWMDTIEVMFPLDIQVAFLEMVSFLIILASTIKKKGGVVAHLEDFEGLLKDKIKIEYFRNDYLYDEPFEDKVSSNVFLCYYMYPELFSDEEWEMIFDNALKELVVPWGGVASISVKDFRFQPYYTGENNMSYHRGDSWFWINNIAAICMHNLNEKKYRQHISKILLASTHDVLNYGCIGYASEISSASEQRSEGCFAQLWSSSTYLEMVDNLFGRK